VIFQTLYFQQTQAFGHQNLQTSQLNWLHIRHSLLGEGQKCMTQHLTATHARAIGPDEVDRRTWPQMDNLFSSSALFDHLIKKIKHCGVVMGKSE